MKINQNAWWFRVFMCFGAWLPYMFTFDYTHQMPKTILQFWTRIALAIPAMAYIGFIVYLLGASMVFAVLAAFGLVEPSNHPTVIIGWFLWTILAVFGAAYFFHKDPFKWKGVPLQYKDTE